MSKGERTGEDQLLLWSHPDPCRAGELQKFGAVMPRRVSWRHGREWNGINPNIFHTPSLPRQNLNLPFAPAENSAGPIKVWLLLAEMLQEPTRVLWLMGTPHVTDTEWGHLRKVPIEHEKTPLILYTCKEKANPML